MVMPISNETEVTMTPTWSDTRAPQISRLNTSRPKLSVPSR